MTLPTREEIFQYGLSDMIMLTKADIWAGEHVMPFRDTTEAKALLAHLEAMQ